LTRTDIRDQVAEHRPAVGRRGQVDRQRQGVGSLVAWHKVAVQVIASEVSCARPGGLGPKWYQSPMPKLTRPSGPIRVEI
jgi:hypothetical protein